MRHIGYEQALNKFGVKYEYRENIPLDEINKTRGKQLQARLEPLDQNLIEQYAGMLRDGYEPPPLLLWKHGKSLLVPLDGNQRLAANDLLPVAKRLKSYSGYVVTEDNPMIAERLCWQFNNLVNGRRLSYEDSLQHAITFVRKYNQPTDATAKDWGVKSWELKAKVRELELRDMAAKKNIETSRLPSQSILTLSPLTKVGEDLYIQAVKTASESGVGVDSLKELVSDIGKAKTMEAKAKLVEDFSKAPTTLQSKAQTKGGKAIIKKGRLPADMLHKHLDQLEDLFSEYEQIAFKTANKSDRERYAGAALTICNKLISIYGLGSMLKGQGV